jgi:nicotinamidase-related amidase
MKSALLVIDVQKGIDQVNHWGGNRNNPEAEGNILKLLSLWRKNNLPVYIIKHSSFSLESPFHPSNDGHALKDFVEPMQTEKLVVKSTTNAFLKTNLEMLLRDENVTNLFVTGFVTNNSVEATVRMAGELGFNTTVVADATACFNKKAIDGTIYRSEIIHQISLANMKDEYASVKATEDVVESFSNT